MAADNICCPLTKVRYITSYMRLACEFEFVRVYAYSGPLIGDCKPDIFCPRFTPASAN
jgi:hypothetical protein